MIQVLLLRIDAPLVSFGGVSVDQRGTIDRFPTLSLLTGLIGNALGYDHSDSALLSDLQSRLRVAVRCDRPGERILDFQTVDLGQESLVDTGWTTRGKREDRKGGSAKEGTHIRYREYWADALFTLAIALEPGAPDIDDIAQALQYPARPLFIGRKACIPSQPLFVARLSSSDLVEALRQAPTTARTQPGPLAACWPANEPGVAQSRLVTVNDQRDWLNQVHSGTRQVREGLIEPSEARHE